MAYGLARVLRAIPQCVARGRMPLPADLLAAEGLPVAEMFSARDRAALKCAIGARRRCGADASCPGSKNAVSARDPCSVPARRAGPDLSVANPRAVAIHCAIGTDISQLPPPAGAVTQRAARAFMNWRNKNSQLRQ